MQKNTSMDKGPRARWIRGVSDETWAKLKSLASLWQMTMAEYLTYLVNEEWERTTGGQKVMVEQGEKREEETAQGR